MNWITLSSRAAGPSHDKLGTPCQDAAASLVLSDGTVLGALADGAGSCKASELGSRLATRVAVRYLERHYPKRRPYSPRQVRLLFLSTLLAVRHHLKREAKKRDLAFKDLSCTLLLFIVEPRKRRVLAAQLGDGFIVARWPGQPYELLFPPTHGEFVNTTHFITSRYAARYLQTGVWRDINPPMFVCASSDGLERLALDCKNWRAHPPFFQPFEDYLRLETDRRCAETQVTAFLQSARVREKSSDDTSLLFALSGKGA